jgi:hypothetical protein
MFEKLCQEFCQDALRSGHITIKTLGVSAAAIINGAHCAVVAMFPTQEIVKAGAISAAVIKRSKTNWGGGSCVL